MRNRRQCQPPAANNASLPPPVRSGQVENYGQDLFQKADNLDRNGQSDLRTAKAFLASSHVMEVRLPPGSHCSTGETKHNSGGGAVEGRWGRDGMCCGG